MANLGTYLAASGTSTGPARVELETGLVLSWVTGNRQVDFYGVTVDSDLLAYDASLAATLVPGDTVAALKVSSTYLVLCKVATA